MRIQNQRLVLDKGDYVTVAFPNGQEIQVGFGGGGQVPDNKPHVFIGSSKNNGANSEGERAFEITKRGGFKEYTLM
jgi:hypothetical protein